MFLKITKMASKHQEESIQGSGNKRSGDNSGDGEKRQKLSFGASKPSSSRPFKGGIQIKLNPPKTTQTKSLMPRNISVFNDESDEEPVEMPPEARMRMRNIGRDTPTSAGPNSFGKTKHGFYTMKKQMDFNNEETDTQKDHKSSRNT